MCCPPPIWKFRHDKLKKIKNARDLVLAMVNHPNGANSQPASTGPYRFSREVRDGWFRPLELTQKSLIFHKKLYRGKNNILNRNSMAIKTRLRVVWTYVRPLTKIWKTFEPQSHITLHFLSIFAYFRLFWPISSLFRLCSKNLVFDPRRNL